MSENKDDTKQSSNPEKRSIDPSSVISRPQTPLSQDVGNQKPAAPKPSEDEKD